MTLLFCLFQEYVYNMCFLFGTIILKAVFHVLCDECRPINRPRVRRPQRRHALQPRPVAAVPPSTMVWPTQYTGTDRIFVRSSCRDLNLTTHLRLLPNWRDTCTSPRCRALLIKSEDKFSFFLPTATSASTSLKAIDMSTRFYGVSSQTTLFILEKAFNGIS
jgi:hypothetical protein